MLTRVVEPLLTCGDGGGVTTPILAKSAKDKKMDFPLCTLESDCRDCCVYRISDVSSFNSHCV